VNAMECRPNTDTASRLRGGAMWRMKRA